MNSEPLDAEQMPMPWLKLWHSFLDSPKIQCVTEALRARYVNLLCVACKFDQGGRLPEVEKIAFMVRLDVETTAETLEALVAAKLIDKRAKGYWVHDWEHWQAAKSKAAEKQKRYRDRRNALRNALPDEAVTRDAHVTSSRAREEEELEKEKDNPPKPPSRGKVMFVLPDWIRPDDWRDFLAMRARIRKPPTERAKVLIVKALERLRAEGHDPAAVLEQSIRNSWQDVFPLKQPGGGVNGAPKPKPKDDCPIYDHKAELKRLLES